jgi:hypothetical protein
MIRCIDHDIIFRNPKPYLKAMNAWHPTLLSLGDGKLLASFDIGQAAESLDYRTWLSRSSDDGRTWTPPVRLIEATFSRPASHTFRLTRLRDGSLIAFGARFHRDDPNEGLINRTNMGFVPMDLLLLRSPNGGETWSDPQPIHSPIVGPGFEVCHSIVELSDGTWLAPTSTWRGWDGTCPNGMKAVALMSHDQGKTWPEYLNIMDGYANGVIYLEQSLIELPDGRLLVVAWAYDEREGTPRQVQYAISNDRRHFSPPRTTGLSGETAKLLHLGDGYMLCVYRRTDQPGLWAALARLQGDSWITLEQQPLWQKADTRMFGQRSAGDELSDLKVGYPSLCRLSDGQVRVAYWNCQDAVFNIRMSRLEYEL